MEEEASEKKEKAERRKKDEEGKCWLLKGSERENPAKAPNKEGPRDRELLHLLRKSAPMAERRGGLNQKPALRRRATRPNFQPVGRIRKKEDKKR